MHELIEMFSNSPHIHLLLNHVPTVGFFVPLALFLVGQIRKNDDLKRTSLVLFFCVAVLSIATYVSGSAAASVLRGADPTPAYPAFVFPQAIGAHEDAALLAFVFMEVTGFFAWLALWQWRRVTHLASGYFTTVLILSIVTFGLMVRAAELGGDIHHPEIREVAATPAATEATPVPAEASRAAEAQGQRPDRAPAQAQTTGGPTSTSVTSLSSLSASGTGWARSFGVDFVAGKTWVWPTLETLHFVGLSMLFTAVLIVNLRMLGMIKSVSCAAVYQLLPIGMLGFGLNLITGMMFFIGATGQYVHNIAFYWKMVFVVLGGLNVAYFLLDEKVWNVKAGDDAPLSSKIAAASAICIWVAVLYCGHMLPFIGDAF